MTGVRQSMVFAMEGYTKDGKRNFGGGKGYAKDGKTELPWIAPPPGSFANHSPSVVAQTVRTMGTKKFDTVAYGSFSGSFEWTFNLDYEYLHPLTLLFEDYHISTDAATGTVTHTFQKSDTGRVKSFVMRFALLNEMAGGPLGSDEVVEVRGCVARNIKFAKPAGSSQIGVTITGFYVDEVMYNGTLPRTDYQPYSGEMAEYMCMWVADTPGTDLPDCSYVANTESVNIGVANNSDPIYNTCSSIAGEFFEGYSDYSFTTTCYSNNPDHYKKRVYGGGIRPEKDPTAPIPTYRPMIKGRKPMGSMKLITYNGSSRDDYEVPPSGDDIRGTYDDSDRSLMISISDVIIKSVNWPKGDGSKLQDTISSTECRDMVFEFKFRGDGKTNITTFDIMDSNTTKQVKTVVEPEVESENKEE